MNLATVFLNGIKFDAYFQAEKTKDPLGTGDSPTEIDIDLIELSLINDSINLIDVIDNIWIDEAKQQIINNELDWM